MNRQAIARQAVAEALRTRQRLGYGLQNAVCVYDLAERLEIEVRFVELPSMEGMYYKTCQPYIIISSLRPAGRRAYTCAHEIGHHARGDGMRVDELTGGGRSSHFDVREFAADCFASALLMPKTAVQHAFSLRGWGVHESTPGQIYLISNYFGVGYQTLVHHLHSGLLLLSRPHAERLLRTPRSQAQALALGMQVPETALIVDRHWEGRPVDVEQGDLLFIEGQARTEGPCVEYVERSNHGTWVRARQPGIGTVEDGSGRTVFVRVARRGFVGRTLYRHLEEAESE